MNSASTIARAGAPACIKVTNTWISSPASEPTMAAPSTCSVFGSRRTFIVPAFSPVSRARATHQEVEEDPVVVPGGVRELRLADHVADGIRSGGAGPVLVVGHDEPFGVERDAALVATQIVRVRPPPCRHQQVGAAQLFSAGEAQGDAARLARHLLRPGAQLEADLFVAEHGFQRRGDLGVFAAKQVRRLVDDGHLSAEAPEHLSELAADVAAAQHYQM